MRRFQMGLALFALPVFAATLFLVGCSKEEKKKDTTSTSSDSKDPTKTTGEKKALAAANGHVKGAITLKGTPPDLKGRTETLLGQINMNNDKSHCLKGEESEKSQQTYRIGGGKVGNVFVWLRPESDSYFKIDPKQVEEAKKHSVKIHQPHCAFIPHCSVLFAKYAPDGKKPSDLKKTGQVVVVENNAEMNHNTKWDGGTKNPGGNKTLPVKDKLTIDDLVPSNDPVRVSCTIHTWMDGYLRVFDHPYATVSLSDTLDGENKVKPDDAKFGTFELKNLPVGKMRIVAWHESNVYLNKGGGKGQEIEIKAGEPTTVNFEFEVK